MKYDDSRKMSEAHVDWFLQMVRPLLIEHMIHGYKHGFEDAANEKQKKEVTPNSSQG
jgi:hypothetical protein